MACAKKSCDEDLELKNMTNSIEYFRIQCSTAGFSKSKCHRLEVEKAHKLMEKFLDKCKRN